MRKMLKGRRITAVVVAMIMVFAMSSMAFATTGQTTVTVHMRAATENPATGDWVMGALTPESFTVNVNSDQTLYQALVAADSADNNLAISWKDVPILDPVTWQPTGETGKAITSIVYHGQTYTNRDSYPTSTSYDGESWMYFFGTSAPTNTNDYPSAYLSQKVVSGTTQQKDNTGTLVTMNNNNLTLSFEHLEFSW